MTYPFGPDAALRAREMALQHALSARAVVLVEGISDQIALEAAALRLGMAMAGVVVVPAGGVGSILTLAQRFGPMGAGLPVLGLCDAAEVPWMCKTVTKARLGIALDRAGLEALGFCVCDRDLEDELIRAVGAEAVTALFEAEGDADAFATLQRQKQWRSAALPDQMRRFLAAGAGRKLRYASLLVQALPPAQIPAPLQAVLAAAGLRAGPVVV